MVNVPLDELLKLSVPERIQLAEDLWDSIAAESEASPPTDAQKAEIERRLAEHDRDPKSAIPWEEVREKFRRRFEWPPAKPADSMKRAPSPRPSPGAGGSPT